MIMRAFAIFALLLAVSACADPATTLSAGARSWCKSAPNCTAQD